MSPHNLLDEGEVFRRTLADLLDTPPQMLQDLRFAELEASRIAGDQVLVELAQNARDAALGHRGDRAPRIRVLVTPQALIVANDGAPLTRAGFEALTRIGRSAKQIPPQARPGLGGAVPLSLGRHGIGFRSVLAVSKRPQVFCNACEGERFAVGFGDPRVAAICRAAARGDQEGCRALLRPEEVVAFQSELSEPRPLALRSLPIHVAARGFDVDGLSESLPVLAFPLWVHDVPSAVADLLGWASEAPAVPPYVTAIHLPLNPADGDRAADALRAQFPNAQRVLMGTRIRLIAK